MPLKIIFVEKITIQSYYTKNETKLLKYKVIIIINSQNKNGNYGY